MAGKKPQVPSSGSVRPSTGAQAKVSAKDRRVAEVLAILEPAGLQKSHWGRRILTAARRGKFNQSECDASASWTTCACGMQDPRLHGPRSVPFDSQLRHDGERFAGEVIAGGREFFKAAETLVRIESRAKQLIAALAVTVADVPGLSTADQTDVAVTSHQEGDK